MGILLQRSADRRTLEPKLTVPKLVPGYLTNSLRREALVSVHGLARDDRYRHCELRVGPVLDGAVLLSELGVVPDLDALDGGHDVSGLCAVRYTMGREGQRTEQKKMGEIEWCDGKATLGTTWAGT